MERRGEMAAKREFARLVLEPAVRLRGRAVDAEHPAQLLVLALEARDLGLALVRPVVVTVEEAFEVGEEGAEAVEVGSCVGESEGLRPRRSG
ncbi:hypothetical protein A0H81_01258 [Grifola frondosa]|uniref:Uncharacterized protein n=1 Tax=Grifola frondosa TaxID=5627 RepID=A0A1C7MNX2_GRIFR|nr:hypothetical protein A0H81_01258 [Grifola frondosa]